MVIISIVCDMIHGSDGSAMRSFSFHDNLLEIYYYIYYHFNHVRKTIKMMKNTMTTTNILTISHLLEVMPLKYFRSSVCAASTLVRASSTLSSILNGCQESGSVSIQRNALGNWGSSNCLLPQYHRFSMGQHSYNTG